MGWMYKFFTVCAALVLLDSLHACPVLDEPFGNITTDQYLEVGSFLKLQCSLFQDVAERDSLSVDKLILKFQGKKVHNVNVVNNLTIEYVVPSANENNTGYYGCFVDHPDYEAPQLVCSSYVAVGYKPLPVESFSCISEEYTNLTCSWKAPFNPVDTTYKLYDYFFRPSVNRTCPVVLNASSCQFRLDTEPVYLKHMPKLHFILVAENYLGSNKEYINIDHYKIIKPGKPKFVLCTNVTRNSLFMRWNAPKGLDYGEAPSGLIYEIKYYSVSTNLPGTKEISKYSIKDFHITINDLVPYTIYEFEVRVRLNISGNQYHWSDVVKHTEKTKSDVPYLAPEISRSAFDYQIIAGNRSITLYWKAIPSEFENGDDFHYVIRYHEHHVPYRFRRDASKKPNYLVSLRNKTSHTFEYLDVDVAYIFNVFAANEVGYSSNETAIVVDKAEKLLQGPKDIMVVSYGEGNYSLTWKDLNRETSHFTLFWCKTLKTRPAKCDGSIEWLHTTNTSHNLLLTDHHTNYQFAVAANLNYQSSGMVWAPCIAAFSGVRYKVSEMKLTPKNSTSLRVQWSLGCRAQEKVIKSYLIYFCAFPVQERKCSEELNPQHKCEAGWYNVTVTDSSKNEHILGALTPYTCYFSFMRVLTNSGWSENSPYAYESTMASAPSDPPRNVIATSVPVSIYSVEIEVLFEPPITPNGIITKYKVYYNESTLEDTFSFDTEASPEEMRVRIKRVHYYKNYSIEVAACVHQACSELSKPVYVYTGISNPTVVKVPRVEVSESLVNITWDPPEFPNGPVDYYEVELFNNETEKSLHYTVNSSSSLTLKKDCNSADSDESVYEFKVRAVNLEHEQPLYGEYSRPTKMVICPSGKSFSWAVIGAIVGITLASFIFLGGGLYLANKCRGEYLARKNINIKLPLELETGFANHLNSFDKLKNGLQRSGPDSSIPCDRAYERLCSFAQEGNQNDPGGWSERDVPSSRNNSGESNQSGLSSADTTRTVVSMDSSAEQECYPAESDSSNPSQSEGVMTQDMDILADSQFVNMGHMAFSRCFIRPTAPKMKCDDFGVMPAYCKFSEIPNMPSTEKSQSPESPYQSRFWAENILQGLKKIKSLPSLYNFVDDESEEVSVSGTEPYSKIGLARSNTHLCESNRPSARNTGYSRFGTAAYTPCGINNNAQIFTVHCAPPPAMPITTCDKNFIKPKNAKLVSDAYSKFGVGENVHSPSTNYVAATSFPSFHPGTRTSDPPIGTCSKPTAAAGADPSHQAQTEAQLQDVEEDDDPRPLMEIIASDNRFSVPPFKVAGTLDSVVNSLNGVLSDINDSSAIEHDVHLSRVSLNSDSCENNVNDTWQHFNGDTPHIETVVDDSEEDLNNEPLHVRDNVTTSKYVSLSELARQNIAANTAVASI